MKMILLLLTLATFALGIFVISRYARAGYPRTRRWLLALFLAGWLNGVPTVLLIIGTIGRDEFLVALVFGLPIGWMYTRRLPTRYRIGTEAAERSRKRKQRDS